MAKVTVIIPTHNRVARLQRAIQSAKKAAADVHVIVVDDASTDETAEVCRNMEGIHYLRSEQNVRQAAARNLALSECNTEYVAFLDDDDLLLPGALDPFVQVLEANPSIGFVYGQVLVADSNCEPTGEVVPKELPRGDIFWRLLEGNYILVHSVLTRTVLVRELGGFDPAVTGVEDWLLWLRIAERFQVASMPEPVGVWRKFTDTSGQTSSNLKAMCIVSGRAQAKGLRLPRALKAPEHQRRDVRKRYLDGLSSVLVNRSISELLERRYRSALATYFTAFRFDPSAASHPYWVKHFVTEQRLRRRGGRQPIQKPL